jgi:uncharacterized membrane protein
MAMADTAAPEDAPAHDTVQERYKKAFFKGLGTLLPTVLTAYIVFATYDFISQNVASPLNAALKSQLRATQAGREFSVRFFELDPVLLGAGHEQELAGAVDAAFPSWFGFALAILITFVVGFFFASFLGNRIWAALEAWFVKLPLIRAIYPSAKQITEFFIKEEKKDQHTFTSVVCVEYPRKGQWSIGFVTGEGLADITKVAGKKFVNVFIPHAPTPITGYIIFAAEDEVHPIDMTIDEGFKFYITGGVVIPPRQMQGRQRERWVADEAARAASGEGGAVVEAAPGRR